MVRRGRKDNRKRTGTVKTVQSLVTLQVEKEKTHNQYEL